MISRYALKRYIDRAVARAVRRYADADIKVILEKINRMKEKARRILAEKNLDTKIYTGVQLILSSLNRAASIAERIAGTSKAYQNDLLGQKDIEKLKTKLGMELRAIYDLVTTHKQFSKGVPPEQYNLLYNLAHNAMNLAMDLYM